MLIPASGLRGRTLQPRIDHLCPPGENDLPAHESQTTRRRSGTHVQERLSCSDHEVRLRFKRGFTCTSRARSYNRPFVPERRMTVFAYLMNKERRINFISILSGDPETEGIPSKTAQRTMPWQLHCLLSPIQRRDGVISMLTGFVHGRTFRPRSS